MQTVRLPWYFRFAKKMILRDTRGGWRLMQTLNSLALLDKVSEVSYFPGRDIWVPLNWSWFWSYAQLNEYEPNTLRTFVRVLNASPGGDFIFLDCGGHIGLVSHYVDQHCPSVEAVWAFEPRTEQFEILASNFKRIRKKATAMNIALSDFSGNARLVVPKNNEDGSYIVPDAGGEIPVTRVDDVDLPRSRSVAMKIDVEGAELAILKGAESLLRQAPHFVVLFEAHKEVMRRTGIDPMECLRFLHALRPCRWALSSQPEFQLRLDESFFDQVTTHDKRDVIVWTE